MPHDSALRHLPAWKDLQRWADEGSIPPLHCPSCGKFLPRDWRREHDYEDGRIVWILYVTCSSCGHIEKRYA